jgi:acetolactate synthase-1/3 small subunit
MSKIVDVTPETLTIEISGPTEKINALEDMIREFGIVESVRTGTIAMERGNDYLCLKNNS